MINIDKSEIDRAEIVSRAQNLMEKDAGFGDLLQTGVGLGLMGAGTVGALPYWGIRGGLGAIKGGWKGLKWAVPAAAKQVGNAFSSGYRFLTTPSDRKATWDALVSMSKYKAPAMAAAGAMLVANAGKPQGPQGFFNTLTPAQQAMLITGGGIGAGAIGMGLYNRFGKKEENKNPYGMPGYYPKMGSFNQKTAGVALDTKINQLEGLIKSFNKGTARFSDIGTAKRLANDLCKLPGGNIGRGATLINETPQAINRFQYNSAYNKTSNELMGMALGLSAIPAAIVAATNPGKTMNFISDSISSGITKGIDFIKRLGGHKPPISQQLAQGFNRSVENMDALSKGLLFGGAGALMGAGMTQASDLGLEI